MPASDRGPHERLQNLEVLRARGLITDAEYSDKRGATLDEL